MINILAENDWDKAVKDYQTEKYRIDRKIDHNNLNSAKSVIQDYAVNHNRIEKIYTEFNKQGINKSKSVLDSIRKIYLEQKDMKNADAIFFQVINQVINRVQDSANYTPIPIEELELCVNILVVDAFIRCKIFENPEGYINATT